MDLLGTEVFDAVQGNEITTIEVDIVFENLGALELPEDVFEQRAELLGIDLVEDGPHLGCDRVILRDQAATGTCGRA